MSKIISIDVGDVNVGICVFDTADPSNSEFLTIGMSNRSDMVTSVIHLFKNDLGSHLDNTKCVVIEQQCSRKMTIIQNLMRMYCRVHDIPVLYVKPQNVKLFMKLPKATGNHNMNKTLMIHAVNKEIREHFPYLLDKFSNASRATKNKNDDYCDATAQAFYVYAALHNIKREDLHGHINLSSVDGVVIPTQTGFLTLIDDNNKRKRDMVVDTRELLPTADDIGCVRSLNKMRRVRKGLRISEVTSGPSNADLQMTTEEILNLPMRRTFSNQSKNRRVGNTLEEMLTRYSLTKIDRCSAMLEAGCSEAVIRLLINKEINDRVKRHSFKMSGRYIDPRHPLTAQLFNDFVIEKIRIRRDQAVLIARHRLAMYKILQGETMKNASRIMDLRKKMFLCEKDVVATVKNVLGTEYMEDAITSGCELDVLRGYINKIIGVFDSKSKASDNSLKALKEHLTSSVQTINGKYNEISGLCKNIGIHLFVLDNQINYDVKIPVNIEEVLPPQIMADYVSSLSDIEKESVKEDAAIFCKPEYRWPLGNHNSKISDIIKDPRILDCPYTGVLFARHHGKDPGLISSFVPKGVMPTYASKSTYNLGTNTSRTRYNGRVKYERPNMSVMSGFKTTITDLRYTEDNDVFYYNDKDVLSTHEEVFTAVTGTKFTDPMVDVCKQKPEGHIDLRYQPRDEIKFA